MEEEDINRNEGLEEIYETHIPNEEINEEIDEISDPSDLETDRFSEDEAQLTADEEEKLDETVLTFSESEEEVSPEPEEETEEENDMNVTPAEAEGADVVVESTDEGGKTDAETSTDTFHDAVETPQEVSSSEDENSTSEDEEDRPSTVRRSERPRKPRRILTYDEVGGISRYTCL